MSSIQILEARNTYRNHKPKKVPGFPVHFCWDPHFGLLYNIDNICSVQQRLTLLSRNDPLVHSFLTRIITYDMIWAHFIPRLRVHNAEPLLYQVLWQLRNVQLIFLIFTCCPTFFTTFSLNNVQMHWPRWRNEYTMSIAYRGAKTIQILSLIAIILSIAPFPLLSLPLAIWPSLSANKQGRQVNALISIATGTAQTQSKLLLALRENMPVSKKNALLKLQWNKCTLTASSQRTP